MKEPEIKLFGRKILVPENGGGEVGEYPGLSSDETNNEKSGGSSGGGAGADSDPGCLEVSKQPVDEEQLAGEVQETVPQDTGQDPDIADEFQDGNASAEIDDNMKTSSTDEDVVLDNHPKTETDQSDVSNTQQKTLKKPDKILPCPRCNSMDTKFCYYNNYNVNQHRHFCKSCQRYWTAGGTMRNVPVGAGRRKNKNSTSHATISEVLLAARMDIPNGFHHTTFKPNGTVLSFGPDSPLCESMASALSLADQRLPNGVRNGHCKIDQRALVPCETGENGYDCSMGSSVTTLNSMEGGVKKGNQKPVLQNLNGIPSPVPYVPGVPWPFPWNSAVPVPAICPPGFPMPIYPAPYWNCSVPVPWNVPLLSVPSPNPNQKPSGSGSGSGSSPNSPLGKHSRNGELRKPNIPEGKEPVESKNSESSILIPKTLRIDDPEEAAKSSIWATLGIKYDSISRKGLFTSLQPKGDERKPMVVTSSPVLHANPAALSQSISFQETA